jgi:hypothetical protein
VATVPLRSWLCFHAENSFDTFDCVLVYCCSGRSQKRAKLLQNIPTIRPHLRTRTTNPELRYIVRGPSEHTIALTHLTPTELRLNQLYPTPLSCPMPQPGGIGKTM